MALKCSFLKKDRRGFSYRCLSRFVSAAAPPPPLPSLHLLLQSEPPAHVKNTWRSNNDADAGPSFRNSSYNLHAQTPPFPLISFVSLLVYLRIKHVWSLSDLEDEEGEGGEDGLYVCLLSLESRSFRQLQFRSGLESTTRLHSEDLHFPSSHFDSHSSVHLTNRKTRLLQQTNIHKSDKNVAKWDEHVHLHLLALSCFCRQ